MRRAALCARRGPVRFRRLSAIECRREKEEIGDVV
jgi:hypothetical protein